VAVSETHCVLSNSEDVVIRNFSSGDRLIMVMNMKDAIRRIWLGEFLASDKRVIMELNTCSSKPVPKFCASRISKVKTLHSESNFYPWVAEMRLVR
jgi:hypothetical protein